MFTIEANFDEVERWLTDFERKQLPFAIAQALTMTVQDAKVEEERLLPLRLDRPTPFTQRGLMIVSATKRRLVAEIRFKDIQANYLELQQTGGTRMPRRRAIAVPVGQRLNRYGNMPRTAIKRMLARSDTFSGVIRGVAGIWQRKKKGKIKLLVAYEPRARYRPRLHFQSDMQSVVLRRLEPNFAVTLANAIRTAR